MRKKRKNKFLIRRIVALLGLIILVLVIKNSFYQLSIKRQQKQIRLLFDNAFIELTNKIYVEDSVIYISEEDIKNIFDDTIYYNVGDKELITTHNKHVAVLHLEESQMMVNDAQFALQGKLKEFDAKIYLPISDLELVYDIETQYIPETNLAIFDSTTKSKKQAIALSNSNITLHKNPFSVAVEKAKRGDTLFIIEENGNNKKVRTAKGNIGYIKTRKLSEEEILREDWAEEDRDEINFKDLSNKLILNQEQLNITSVSTAFATYSQRTDSIKNIYNQVMQNQYQGVCIDFQEIDDVNSFYRFLIELSPRFKESGLKVLVKATEQLDKEKLKNIVDFIIE